MRRAKRRYKRIAARKKGRRSDFELRVEAALHKSAYPVEYEVERLEYTEKHKYVPDFTDKETKVIYEAKGRFTSRDRSKMLAVKRAYPERDIRIIFMRNNPIYTGSKTRYLDWAKAHGFPATVFPELPI